MPVVRRFRESRLNDAQTRYDEAFGAIEAPGTVILQAQPENQWTLHPLLDGCEGKIPYRAPSRPVVIE